MRIVLALVFAILIGVASAAPQPRVRVEFEAQGQVLVGQQIRVDVTVLAPNYFLSAVEFPTFDLPGAVVTLPDENALNGNENIDGETYASVRRSYLITPQQAGSFVLPPAAIKFRYAAEPGQPSVEATVTLPPQGFTATAPAGTGAQGAAPAVLAKVVVTQTLDGDPTAMKVGDALTRTIEIFAPNTQAMMIPPAVFDAPAGVRVYARDPTLSDVTTPRGEFTGGKRIDQATYVFEQAGAFTLPSIEVGWFNVETGKPDVSRAPAVGVTVSAVPAPQADLAPPPAPLDDSAARASRLTVALWAIGLIAVGLAALWGLSFFGPRLRARTQARREAWRASEPAAFAQLRRACKAGDAAGAYRALGVWSRRQGVTSVQALCRRAPRLRSETESLERHLYAGGTTPARWSSASLIASAAAARTALRDDRRRHSRPAALPPLNP